MRPPTYPRPISSPTQLVVLNLISDATLWPCVLLEEDGGFSWCFIRHGQPLGVSSPIVWAWSLRDLLMVRNTPAPIVLVDPKSGTLVWQNSASMELIGVHGVDNIQTRPSCKDPIETTRLDYLSLLFHNEDDLKDTMIKLVGQGKPWNSRMMVQSPVLKSLIRVSRRTALWYDVSISQVRDPVDLAPLLTILMIDVTSIVEAERRVKLSMESQHALLKQILPQQVTDILLQRVQNKGQAQMTSEMIHDRFSIKSESMVGTGSGDYFGEGVLSSGPSLGGGGSVLSSAPSFNNALTRQQVMDLSTKHDEVSILFADIVGFTNLSSKVDPSAVMLMLSDLFGRFDAYLDEFDVWKVGTIGDCYFCITGLFDRSGPDNEKRLAAITDLDGSFWSADEDDIGQGTLGGRDPQHAEKMLGFAKSMMDLLRDVPSPLGGNIQMRVGIHTGSIWSGVVGRKMPRFDVFGDAVNTASRMESHGIPGKIHVSEEFAKQLPDEKWLERNIQVKGKGEMKTYLLEDEGYDAAPPPEGSRTLMRMQSSILQQVKMEVKQGFFSSWWNKPKTQAKASKKKPSDGVQTVSFDKP